MAAYIVPLTLVTIGLVGIYESCFKKPDEGEGQHGDTDPSTGTGLA